MISLVFQGFSQEITMEGYVTNRFDKTPVPCVRMIVMHKTNNVVDNNVFTDENGHYTIRLLKNKFDTLILYAQTTKYVKTPTAPLGFFATDQKYTIATNDSLQKNYRFELTPVSGEIRFPSVLFIKNSAEFFDGSQSQKEMDGTPAEALDRMYQVMINNPTIIVMVDAHCSHEEKEPDKLSAKRAQKVIDVLVKKGIDSVRVQGKAWGIKKLKIPDHSIVKAKTLQEKEALRQKNRRAVFKILSWDYPAPLLPTTMDGKIDCELLNKR